MAEPTRKRRRAGIRPRITTLATLIVAAALLIGAVAFWIVLRTSLYGQLEAAAQQDAAAFAEQLHDGATVETLPDVDDDRFWQVIDADSGAVIAGSDVAEDVQALAGEDRIAPPLAQFED
jgi:hypothetical protein